MEKLHKWIYFLASGYLHHEAGNPKFSMHFLVMRQPHTDGGIYYNLQVNFEQIAKSNEKYYQIHQFT